MIKVFIVGSSGTTGLRLQQRLLSRPEVELLTIDEKKRKNPAELKKLIAASDITFLCLPDEAARQMAELARDTSARIIDTSTAHRVEKGWRYGFPELSAGHYMAVETGTRIAVPGCHASGFVALIYPLIVSGILNKEYPLSCFSVTGYSGGGKAMINEYESPKRPPELQSPRQYALSQKHKHLKEMTAVCGLSSPPAFIPTVADYYSGIHLTVPLHTALLSKKPGVEGIKNILTEHYQGCPLIRVVEPEVDFMAAEALTGKDYMEISVTGNDDRVLLHARFDNLGKGASGAAIQCFNIMSGLEETAGLVI
ncbi:MAG TPA: N-acetyl-gamma-glutamyl-phosphate reductase [Clostridiales bacterium]|jgi:N-acetyl-gamma-glutamyl-phosphate reductase|nr:N-acetyl-gamma-glutamyl-phosphate reductase [Clostridiales bacterium]